MLKENKHVFLAIVVLVFWLVNMAGCSQKPTVENAHPAPAVEETQPFPASQSASDTTPVTKELTQQEAAELFVHNLGYKIVTNSGASYDLQFPDTFTEVKNGVRIGELLKRGNELSKQYGMDFSGYLGKQVTLYTYSVENKNKVVENIVLVMDGNEVAGYWIDWIVDEMGRPGPAFNVIVGAYEANGSR
ncbi:DUF4830 domain-containing protein [Moorella sulfitireducens (nom. illeg.)]|uniref:DUF4830 domain-containing protein n=1 Tax=Neomoorella sulfitireducens TaxID=2972948 RepID=UPI0021AD07DD|nr:DUF4830 domain-containing protein [Moorella sulfitireducens]